ncbi:MAG: lysophospholipid acyltransferase family protein [Chitinophagaceae bacterium]|jgi:Kdo2-lipid IVA lauroyltransferase/acyltransferase|nr:lysophospholipid acyltransferase family protein [Chitinophagaceae bacterium]
MYYFVFGILYLFSLLPMWVLYRISDLGAFMMYAVFRYRRDVVFGNISQALPDKSEEERKAIAKKFYRNFTDNWIETIKLMSISKASMNKRVTGNFEVFHQLFATGKAVQVNLGHFFNWEMMTLHAGINQPYTFLTVYLPQSNKIMNRLILYIRGRWGNPLLSSNDMARAIIPWRKKQYLLALGADQRPVTPDNAYWLNFLNKPAGFVKGPEKFARGQNIPVVMMTTTKKKRGHYHFDYFLLCEDPKALPDGELIRQYVRHLEENIRLQPELYLWSHKRWKHPWKEEYAKLWVDEVEAPSDGMK